jgi:hypothetical protein
MACDPQSGWVTAIQIGAAALSPIIAIGGGWIAWLQVRINRNKLKLDRFDKRFAVHEAAMSFAASVVVNGDLSLSALDEFLVKTRGARFLVSKEVADYLEELHLNAVKFRATRRSLERVSIPDQERTEYGDRLVEMTEWFQKQLDVIPEKFTPFLSVDDI